MSFSVEFFRYLNGQPERGAVVQFWRSVICLIAGLGAALVSAPPVQVAEAAQAGTIRVVLQQKADSMNFKVSGNYHLVDQSTGKEIAALSRDNTVTAQLVNGRMTLRMQDQKKTLGPFDHAVAIREGSISASILGGSGSNVIVVSTAGLAAVDSSGKTVDLGSIGELAVRGDGSTVSLPGAGGGLNLVSLDGGTGYKRYRGSLEILLDNGKLSAVNELNIEDYLRGVVPSEMPAYWSPEALKAQAVAARNYALQRAEVTRGDTYNVFSNISSQVYGGYDAESPATNRAVEETRGIVMLSGGSLVQAFFHSSSGGFTENCEDVWKEKLSYIRGKADPYDKNDPNYNWQVTYTAEQLKDTINYLGYKFKAVTGIEELARTSSGARVEKIAVTGTAADGKPLRVEISNADNVRIALDLKSALFKMEKTYDKNKRLTGVKITGSGWGHGLGLSQWGAGGMAKAGYNYQDILKYYYTGINLVSNYGRAANTGPVVKPKTSQPYLYLPGADN